MKTQSQYRVKFHPHYVEYWSVYKQQWEPAYSLEDISDREYAAMNQDDRKKVLAMLK